MIDFGLKPNYVRTEERITLMDFGLKPNYVRTEERIILMVFLLLEILVQL